MWSIESSVASFIKKWWNMRMAKRRIARRVGFEKCLIPLDCITKTVKLYYKIKK